MPRAAAKPKLPRFEVTVMASSGVTKTWSIGAKDIEDAAHRACRKVTLNRKAMPKRTTGAENEPGWFYPHVDAKWPFAGNAYKVEPEVSNA